MDVHTLIDAAYGLTKTVNQLKQGKITASTAIQATNKLLRNSIPQNMAKQGGPKGFRGANKQSVSASTSKQIIPSAVAYTTTNVAPKYVGNDHGVTLTGRDLVSTVAGTSAFTCAGYAVNPGQYPLFPVLANRAENYEQYRIKDLVFEWVPVSGTTRDGVVTLCFNPEATTDVPRNEQTITAMAGSVTSPVYGSACKVRAHGVKSDKILYVRADILSSGEDLRTTDYGKFFIATSDCSSVSAMGKLYVNYKIELMYPRAGYPTPMLVGVPGLSAFATLFDNVYNGHVDTVRTGLVAGRDLAYFNASGSTNYIILRKPGNYMINVCISNNGLPGGIPEIGYWAPGADTLIKYQFVSTGSGSRSVSVIYVQVNKLNSSIYTVGALAATSTLGSTLGSSSIHIVEVSDKTMSFVETNFTSTT